MVFHSIYDYVPMALCYYGRKPTIQLQTSSQSSAAITAHVSLMTENDCNFPVLLKGEIQKL